MQYQKGSIGLFFRGDPTLKLWSPFDDNVIDFSGKNHNGTITGSVPFLPAKFGKGASFNNNTANYIDYGNPTDFNFGTGPFTLMAWVKFNNVSTDQTILDKHKTGTSPYTGFQFGLYNGALIFNVCDTGNYSIYGNTTLITNKWYFVVATRNGSIANIYLNGQLNGSGTCANGDINYSVNLVCGRLSASADYPFNGIIDEVAIFSRALSPQEISQYYRWATSPKSQLTVVDIIPSTPNFLLFFN